VADVAAAIGRELKLTDADVENLRVAALLHEVGTRRPAPAAAPVALSVEHLGGRGARHARRRRDHR